MSGNQRFSHLLKQGIGFVKAKRGITLAAVNHEIAELTNFSPHLVEYWKKGNPPRDTETLEQVVSYCVREGGLDRAWARSMLLQGRHHSPNSLIDKLFPAEKISHAHIFMCYARGRRPDQAIGLTLAQELSKENTVFFDQATQIVGWAKKVEEELKQCNYVVILLSNESVSDEVVLAQIDISTQLFRDRGKPIPLPIAVNYLDPLPTPLDNNLGGLNWAVWREPSDTPRLVQKLKNAIAKGSFRDNEKQPAVGQAMGSTSLVVTPPPKPSAYPSRLEMPEGAIDTDSAFYIERDEDRIALRALANNAGAITIKAPRQMGKSSLLVRLAESAKRLNKVVVFLDFQLMQPLPQDASAFFQQFCSTLSYYLDLSDETDNYWSLPLSDPFRCTQYVENEILKKVGQPIFLAMDEADIMFESQFYTDFFAMLRSWHGQRARHDHWKRLNLAIVTSTESYYFIDRLTQSPFNVAENVDLPYFSLDQVLDLNTRHRSPFSKVEIEQLMDLLNGHPYLVRRALFLVATQQFSAPDLIERATDDNGPFGNHLRALLLRLRHKPDLFSSLQEAFINGTCEDEVYFRLRGAGLIKKERNVVVPRSNLYAAFLKRHFIND
jgi:hypothetical protein